MKKKTKWFTLLALFLSFSIYLTIDYVGPDFIELKEGQALGMRCKKADDLSIQYIDQQGSAWASRGMIIYRRKKDENQFTKIIHVPTGFTPYWLRNFSFVRWITQRPECIEFTVFENGDISALSAGYMWFYQADIKKFSQSLKLAYYSKGNQGIFNNGILQTKQGNLFFGEYFKNEKDTSVSLFESNDHGKSWHMKYSFSSHKIRHIHSIQQDPFSDLLWMTTGDEGGNYIYWSDDQFKSIHPIGFGEKYFTTQLLFTKDEIYWGSDTETGKDAGIYRWNRKTEQLNKVISFPSIFFYSNLLKKGTMVFTTVREGFTFEQDKYARVFIKTPDENWNIIKQGEWKKNAIPILFQKAKTRLPRENNHSEEIYMSVQKQSEFSDNELIVMHEDELIKKCK
ncbi:MAG: hypothetical protein RIR96_1274 [Bacteroidota bacterium]|jgi:hypothetical protein